MKEGNLEAPTRHAIAWTNPEFYDEVALDKELEGSLTFVTAVVVACRYAMPFPLCLI